MSESAGLAVLGVIPARGGSKGIPRKNILPLAGRPMICWTIDVARRSGVLDRVVVSTDDPEIAEIARGAGAEVPFFRPPELARDETPAADPVLHLLDALGHRGYHPDWVMLLQPTSPLRSVEDIRGAVDLAARVKADAVVSVSPAVPPPQWTRRINSEGILEDYVPAGALPAIRQELPPAYALNGAVYLIRPAVLAEHRSFHPPRSHAFIMPRERSIDVDTPWDFTLADILKREGNRVSP